MSSVLRIIINTTSRAQRGNIRSANLTAEEHRDVKVETRKMRAILGDFRLNGEDNMTGDNVSLDFKYFYILSCEGGGEGEESMGDLIIIR